MARKAGDRNRDFELKRTQILDALERRLLAEDASRISMNEMAAAAEVSVSSLRQHLGDRAEVMAAVLARQGTHGAPYLAMTRAEPVLALEPSLQTLMQQMLLALERGLGTIVSNGLSMGLRDVKVGPSFVENILEPILQSVEIRLDWHQKRGELGPCDLRVAALALVSPLVLGVLHQHGLCGNTVRPLSLPDMLRVHVGQFIRAYGISSAV